MKKLNSFILISLIVSMFIPSVIAYNEFIDDSGYLPSGLWGGLFQEQDTKSSQSVNNPLGMPLTADLNGDGDIEIVVARDDGFSIFRNYDGQIFLESSYLAVGGWESPFQSFILFDIDNDGLVEIVLMTSDYIHILEYDGDSTSIQRSFTHNMTTNAGMVQCKQADSCIAISADSHTWTTATRYLRANTFGSGGLSEQGVYTVMTQSGNPAIPAYRGICLNSLRHIEVADIDGLDTEVEYVFNALRIGVGSSGYNTETMYWFALRTNASNYIVNRNTTSFDMPYDMMAAPISNSCTSGSSPIESQFSPVLVVEATGTDDDGKEIAIAYMTSSNNYKLFHYRRTGGAPLDEFPANFDQEGRIISNVFLASAFPDTSEDCEFGEDVPPIRDTCVMGYNDDDEIIKVLCGSGYTNEDHLVFTKTREFYFDTSKFTGFNFSISSGRNEYYRVAHATQQSYSTVEDDDSCDPNGFNPSEFYSPYGILKIKEDSWLDNPMFTNNDADLEIAYNIEGQEGVLIGVPTKQNVVSPDLLFLTYNNIFLVDNGDYNRRAYISTRSIDPCTSINDSLVAWQSGTDVDIQVIGDDDENDMVSSKVTLYYDMIVPPTTNETEYSALTDETTSDGDANAELKILGSDGNYYFDVAMIARNIQGTGYVDSLNIDINGDDGNPQDSSFVYDMFLCPTNVDELSATDDVSSDCSETATLVKDNVDLSSVLGTTTGTINIPFDTPFATGDNEKLIIIFKYVSGTLGNDKWKIDADDAPSENLVKYVRLTAVDTPFDNDLESEIFNIELINSYLISQERTNGWSSYVPTGIPMTHHFDNVDYNIPVADMKIELRDEANEDNPRFLIDTFSVQSVGVENGECITIDSFDNPDAPIGDDDDDTTDPTGSPLDPDDNAITNGLNEMDSLGFAGLGGTLKWLFIMTIVACAIFFTGAARGYSGTQTTTMAVIIMLFMVIIGVYLKVIPVALVVVGGIIAFGLTVGLFKVFFGGTRY